MDLRLEDTIAALSSPPGPAPRGIVRLSGPDVVHVLQGLFTATNPRSGHASIPPVDTDVCRGRASVPAPPATSPLPAALEGTTHPPTGVHPSGCREASPHWQTAPRPTRFPGHVSLPGFPTPLPADLHLWPNHRSYTGQPLAEFHTLGAPPLLDALLSALCEHGARPARRGEFTLRAFLAGRIDLVQAEAVLGVIDADDQTELESALAQLAGGLSGRMHAVRSDLLELLADLEAGLDFVDEDIEFVHREDVQRRLREAEDFTRRLLDSVDERARTTGHPTVVLAGLPNAGKSTLFNALAGTDAALVSPASGTTRDWLEVETPLAGFTVQLVDTAGGEWRPDALSRQAQQLRRQRLESADLVVWCTAADLQPAERQQDERLRSESPSILDRLILVETKADVTGEDSSDGLGVSATTGRGLSELRQAIAERLESAGRDRGELLGSTAARSRDSLTGAADALARAREAGTAGLGDEFVALELRAALDHLGHVVGAVYTDDVLDRIFSRFCIGK